MVPKLSEVLFILALAAPLLAVFVGLATLLMPTQIQRAAGAHGREPARA